MFEVYTPIIAQKGVKELIHRRLGALVSVCFLSALARSVREIGLRATQYQPLHELTGPSVSHHQSREKVKL